MGRDPKPARPPRPTTLRPPPAAGSSARQSVRPSPKRAPNEPTVLLIGAGENLDQALALGLARHHVYVETAPREGIVGSVVAVAPDLILLAGVAAKDCGTEALAELSSSPMSSVVPVVILEDNPALDARLRAFRHGAAAVIPHTASIDAIADQVARLAREIPERGGESLGVVGEATLHEFVQTLGNELRSGILSVKAGEGQDAEAVRLVLGRGRPLAEFIDDFVTRVRRHVVHAEPLRWEFDERAGGTVELLGADEAETQREVSDVKDLRVLLADSDSARADSVAQELRAHGAVVAVTDLEPNEARFMRLRQADPAILLVGENDAQGAGYELLRRMRHDTRLRWASLLVVRWDEVWSERSSVPAIGRLAGTISALAEPEKAIRARAESGQPFDTRLEIVGPARCLRALAACGHALRVSVYNPRVRLEIDLSEGLVVGATGEVLGEAPAELEGPIVLAALLVLSSGRVHVEPVGTAHTANVMSTIDVALSLADAEKAPIAPSLPSPAASIPPPPPPSTSLRAPAVPSLGAPLVPSFDAGPSPTAVSDAGSPRRGRIVAGIAAAIAIALALVAAVMLVMRPSLRPWKSARHRAAPSVASAPVPAQSIASPAPSGLPAPSASGALAAADSSAEPTAVDAATAAGPESAKPEGLAGPIEGSKGGSAIFGCDTALAGEPERSGRFQAQAGEQIQIGRREIVHGDLDAALRAFCRAVAYDDENTAALSGLARVLLLRRDGAGAAFWAKKALEHNPADLNLQGLLGDGLARKGDEAGAKRAYMLESRITDLGDPTIKALSVRALRLGRNALLRKDYARAERLFRRAAVLDPRSVEATTGLAHTLIALEEPQSAVTWAQRAVSADARSAEALVVLGDALLARGDATGARSVWKKALKLQPKNLEAQSRLENTAH